MLSFPVSAKQQHAVTINTLHKNVLRLQFETRPLCFLKNGPCLRVQGKQYGAQDGPVDQK